jgi:8-oxo-dGTP diphosphatase
MGADKKGTRRKFCYDYPRPMVTTDILVFGWDAKQLRVMLIRRKNDPYRDCWAIPGGFIDMDETLEETARRELEEETGISRVPLHRFGVFGAPGRDPRGRTVTVAYMAFLRPELLRRAKAGDDAAEVCWFPARRAPKLAFDHSKMLRQAVGWLREFVIREPSWLALLPRTFSIMEVQNLYESILGRKMDTRGFRRRMIASGWIRESGRKEGELRYSKK